MALEDLPDNGRTAFDFFVEQGLAPHQASGIVGNLQGESGQGLNPNAINRGDGRDGSDSIGIGQWNGSRAVALKAYADSKGVPWNDLNTQLEFLHSELKGPESNAFARLQAAKTPEEAGQAMLAYERPKDWNKPGAHPERAQYAAAVHARYAQPPQASPAAPANGLLAQPAGGLQPPQAGGLLTQSQAPPIFPQAPPQAQPQQQAQGQGGDIFSQMQPPGQPPPIFFPPRRSPDLSKLRAALGQSGGFSFPRRG